VGAIALAVLFFTCFPVFVFVVAASFKRNAGKLVIVAVLILVMRLFDLFWMNHAGTLRRTLFTLAGWTWCARRQWVACGLPPLPGPCGNGR